MMAKKDRYPPGHSATFGSHYESEGMAGCSGRVDSVEDTRKKWIDLNSASRSGFAVPVQVIPVSKLSSLERKDMVLRLTSELAQIKLIQNKIEFQKQTVVNAGAKSSSSDMVNYNSAQQKVMQIGNPKKQYGLGSAPGKKGSVLNRSISGRFPPGNKNTHVNANVGGLLKQCEGLLKKLMSQQHAWVFNTPVDVVKLNIPDYFDVIKNPMDLGTVKKKITSGKYSCPMDFLADVRLTFTNAKTYNPPGTDVHIMAGMLSQYFELRWKVIEKKVVPNTTQSLPGKCGNFDETEINKPSNPSKKRKVSPRPHELIREPVREPVNPRMTDAEKNKLSSELEYFIGDLPDSIINFLKAHTTSKDDGREDEIEIDIDDLNDDALFTLRKLLDDHSQEKNKSLAKSEACEIELPYVSGLSNSSLHVDKGNDPIDEDVDIGGNEAPVTSCHPVLIEKDIGGRAEECNEAGPEFEGGSECSKVSSDLKQLQDDMGQTCESDKKVVIEELVGRSSGDGMDQVEQGSQLKPCSSDSDGQLDGESTQNERQMSPDKLYRAALLKNRFADTILKAREKTLTQVEKADPEKLRREKEELEMHMKREKARLQAEAKAAEEARRRAEAEAAAEAKRRRELEREAARDALLKMEKTVEINENSRFLHDLEMLSSVPPEQLPSSVDDVSPEHSLDGFGSFKFGSTNALEQLGLYMKVDEEEEEGEGPSVNPTAATGDVEEGEID